MHDPSTPDATCFCYLLLPRNGSQSSHKHSGSPQDARAAAHFSARDSMSTRACAASSGLRKRRGDAGRGASGCGSYSGSSGAANRPTSAPMPLYGTCAARPAGAFSGAEP